MEVKLSKLIDVDFIPYAPALDPYIYDLQGKTLSQPVLDRAIKIIKNRLERAGFDDFDIKLISPVCLGLCVPNDIEYHTDENCGDIIYLLTFSANGNRLISPPYELGTHKLMSWTKWIEEISAGRMLPLMIFAPWAQAKFINGSLE
jgi:hypothetical protein